MSKLFFLFLLIVYLPSAAADSHDSASKEFRVLKTIELEGEAQAFIVVREEGHLLGQPYQVELRMRCDSKDKEIMDLPIHDSYSVCDLSTTSLKINNQNSAIAMKVKNADLSHYNDQLDRGIASPEVLCQKETLIKKFSLRNICK